MAISITIAQHKVAFATKLLAGNGGAHIYNMVLSADTDNGALVGKGAYVSFDQYEVATAPTDFAGVITEQAADGNWYVEVTTPADAIFIYEVPESTMGNYDSRFTALSTFYNKAGDVVRGYALAKGDVVELSADWFSGTPAAGKAITFASGKYTVGA